MRNRTAIRWAKNPFLSVLLLLGFLSRALIPIGFMPGPGGVVICTGYAPTAASQATQAISDDMSAMEMAGMDMSDIDMPDSAMAHPTGHSKGGSGSPEHEGSGICPYAAAATTMASGHTAVAITVVPAAARQIELPSLPFVPRGTIVPTRLPRGPPSLA